MIIRILEKIIYLLHFGNTINILEEIIIRILEEIIILILQEIIILILDEIIPRILEKINYSNT